VIPSANSGVLFYDRLNTLPPGTSIYTVDETVRTRTRLHFHNFLEIAYIRAGGGYHLSGSYLERLESGDMLIINPSIPHCYLTESGQTMRVCTVAFTESALMGLFSEPEGSAILGLFSIAERDGGGPSALPVSVGHRIDSIVDIMLVEDRARRPGYQLILKGYLMVLLTQFYRNYIRAMQESVGRGLWPRFAEIMKELYTGKESVHIGVLSRRLGWSPDHFSRVFKKVTGCKPGDFIRRMKMQRAAILLLTTNRSVEDIAQEMGYSSARSFRYAFYNCLGVTPQDYRRFAADKRHECNFIFTGEKGATDMASNSNNGRDVMARTVSVSN
jgi:AraC-like DNA-binding protein